MKKDKRGVLVRLLLGVAATALLGGCFPDQTLTNATIAPEIAKISAADANGALAQNDLEQAGILFDYSSTTTAPTTADATVALAQGTLVVGFNQLLDGDSVETTIIAVDANNNEVFTGSNDWASAVPVIDHWEGKDSITAVTLTTGTFDTKTIQYRPEGFYAFAFTDPITKIYPPAVVFPVPATGNTVIIHIYADGIKGVSGKFLDQATYSDGTPVVIGGRPIAATILFTT